MSQSLKIEKVAVLGAGVMGSQIAAHLTNAKIPVLAFDINQEVAEKGIKTSVKLKPSAYYNPKTVEIIKPLTSSFITSLAQPTSVIIIGRPKPPASSTAMPHPSLLEVNKKQSDPA